MLFHVHVGMNQGHVCRSLQTARADSEYVAMACCGDYARRTGLSQIRS